MSDGLTNREIPQRAVLVLGAGRSGTSLATRAMQAVGVELGDNLKPPSRKNPTGFFEDARLLRLSKQLRRTLGLRPDSLRLLEDDVWTSVRVEPFYALFTEAIETQFSDDPVWGFKYARTMRLLPFWVRLLQQLNIEPSYVMPIRNPLSVARSRAKLDAHRGAQENSDLEWLVNVVPYFRLVRGSRLAVMDYDRLLTQPVDQLERLAGLLGMPIGPVIREGIERFASDFLRPDLQHTQFTLDDLSADRSLNPLVRGAYILLDQLAEDPVQGDSESWWAEWGEIEAGVEDLRPVLARFDVLSRELRKAQWNPLSPLPMVWRVLRQLWVN